MDGDVEEKEEVSVQGTVVCIRQLGAKLVFIDVMDPCERIEVIIAGFLRVPSMIHVGDFVEVKGALENNNQTIRVNEVPKVLRYWKEFGKGKCFVSIPARSRFKKKELDVHCKFWISEKVCRKEGCRYLHVEIDSEEFKKAAKSQNAALHEKRNKQIFDKDDPHAGGKSRKSKRAKLFAQWLVKTFALNKNSVVLDVAGGHGKLSIALLGLGVGKCIVVDPRMPSEKRAKFVVENLEFDRCEFNKEYKPSPLVTCIVGMHPDEATDEIVHFGMNKNIPFAGLILLFVFQVLIHLLVMPCCVFADTFVERKLENGECVRTFEQLILYLMSMSKAAKDFLPLQGRNVIVYKKGSTV